MFVHVCIQPTISQGVSRLRRNAFERFGQNETNPQGGASSFVWFNQWSMVIAPVILKVHF